MDADGPGCFSVLAGLSFLIYAALSFVYFRRGIEELGAGEVASLVLAVLGSLIVVAAVVGFGQVARSELGCLAMLACFVVGAALLVGHYLVLRQGDPPAWVLDPPTPVEWIWDDPPQWAETVQWIVGVLVGTVTAFAAAGRGR